MALGSPALQVHGRVCCVQRRGKRGQGHRVYDLVHAANVLRKERGLEVTDRIVLTIPDDGLLPEFEDRIKAETLAVEIRTGAELDLETA